VQDPTLFAEAVQVLARLHHEVAGMVRPVSLALSISGTITSRAYLKALHYVNLFSMLLLPLHGSNRAIFAVFAA
jgi:hypothetical protein